ncbi:hypothetical protein JR338_08775 [Chloroflexota bacterium]|nr:hypothetical protein JR338_08775 [Chloroflexota bacterium]
MMLKHSTKSVLRSPLKSILFVLLLSAAILFVSLGSSMLYSADRMLQQADEQFTTTISLKYGGLHDENGAWADQAFQETLAQLDFEGMVNHPAVMAVDTERDIFAYAGDDTDIVQKASPFSYVNIFTFAPRYFDDDDTWVVMSHESIFGDEVGDLILVKVNPLTMNGENIPDFESGHVYFGAALITYVNNTRVATFIKASDLTNHTLGALDSAPEIIDITDRPDYFDSEEGAMWNQLIQSIKIIDESFSVTVSSYLPIMAAFHQNQTWLTDGEFELTDGTLETVDQDVCYISDRVAALLGLEVGDTWPLKLHYTDQGDPAFSYWEEDGFIYDGNIRIAGIFNEVPGLSFTVYMPFPSWVEKAPDNYEFLRVQIDNKEVESYLNHIKGYLTEIIEVTVEDQGYANAIKPVETLKSQAITLTTISAVAGVAVSILFSYLFISRQRETAQIMMMMGTGRPKTVSYLLYGILLVALIATIVGSLIAGAFDVQVTETVWQALQDAPGQDERYSERALGIPTTFVPEIATASWVRWSSAGALILIILIITIIFALTTLRKPKRKKVKEFKAPKLHVGKGMAFVNMPTVSLRFALRSIRRNFLRSLIVPVTAFLLAAFIMALGLITHQQELNAVTVYDDVPTTAYMTTFLGYSREVPLQLQANIFRLLDPDYTARNSWTMIRNPLPKGALLSIREDLTEDSDFFEDVMLTSKMHYTLMGLSSDAEGHTYNLSRRPEVPYHSNRFGYDWFEDKVRQMPFIYFIDSFAGVPEFSDALLTDTVWLEGYSNDSLKNLEYFAVLPDRYADENGIELGDTVRLALYLTIPDRGVLMEAYDFVVAGTYYQGSRPPVIYTPWAVITDIPIIYDYMYEELMIYDGEIPEDARYSNEYLADTINSATFLMKNTQELSDFRDYLEDNYYSQIGSINRNRLAVVIEDKALMDAIESIDQHLAFMNIIRPVMLALSTVIGFILSYLLTRNRLHEFAVMRSLGTKRFHVYSAFFLEQLLLFLLGIVPVLIILLVNPAWIAYFGLSLIGFILLYALGITIAIYLMSRAKILDILFIKE